MTVIGRGCCWSEGAGDDGLRPSDPNDEKRRRGSTLTEEEREEVVVVVVLLLLATGGLAAAEVAVARPVVVLRVLVAAETNVGASHAETVMSPVGDDLPSAHRPSEFFAQSISGNNRETLHPPPL